MTGETAMNDETFDRDAAQRQRQLETLDRLAQRFGTSLSSALSRNVAEGRRLDDALSRVGRTLLNVTLRAAMRPLRSSLESLFRSALTGSLSGGDAPTPFAKGGVVAAPTYFPLGRGLGLMGEQGAEAVMPLARGPDGRLGVRAGGASARAVQVTVNISTRDAESFRRSEAQVSAALARAVARGQRGL
jgi:phage-related minor tail protein